MISFLTDTLSYLRQPMVELIIQVTLWSLLGVIVYSCFRRVAYSNRHLLLGFCLGTLALSLLILLPLHIWSPPMWPDSASGTPMQWKVRQIFDVSAEAPDTAQLYEQPGRAVEQPSTAMMNGETWLVLLLFLLGAFVVASSLRLLLGLLAMEHWRRSSKAVDDFELHQLLNELRRAMGIRQAVSLRITTSLGSPATVGWWRPIILLPASWRQWSFQEQRAVLAHELAHVRNSDYPLWLLVQLAAAVHAYHPLVRWLVHRLQGELELAADRLAAPQAGGEADYMRSLCSLALRHGSCGAGNIALALLPVHLPLSWRMMMLRSGNASPRVPRMWSRLLFGCGLVGVAVLIAGLRGPVKAEEPKGVATSVNANVILCPSGSEKPHDHPESQVVALQFHVVEIKRELLAKLDIQQVDIGKTNTFISHDVTIEQINQRLDAKDVRVLASIKGKEFQVWSEVKSGIQINKKGEGLLNVFCTPLAMDNKAIQLKLHYEIAHPIPNKALVVLGIPQVINQEMGDTHWDNNNACLVMPAWKKGGEATSDKVLIAFVQATKVPETHDDGVFWKIVEQKQPSGAPAKPCYEIELQLVQTTPQVMDDFWKSVDQDNGKEKHSPSAKPRLYTGAKVAGLLSSVQADHQSCILACPRIITVEGTPARIAAGEAPDEGIKISVDVKRLGKEKQIQLTLHEEVSFSVGDGTENKTTLKQGVTVALEEGQSVCIGSESSKESGGSPQKGVIVMIAKVRKVSMSPIEVKK